MTKQEIIHVGGRGKDPPASKMGYDYTEGNGGDEINQDSVQHHENIYDGVRRNGSLQDCVGDAGLTDVVPDECADGGCSLDWERVKVNLVSSRTKPRTKDLNSPRSTMLIDVTSKFDTMDAGRISNVIKVDSWHSRASFSFDDDTSTTCLASPRRRTLPIDEETPNKNDDEQSVSLVQQSSLHARLWSSYSAIYDSGDDDVCNHLYSPFHRSELGPRTVKYNAWNQTYPTSFPLSEKKFSMGLDEKNISPTHDSKDDVVGGNVQNHKLADYERISSFRKDPSSRIGKDSQPPPERSQRASSMPRTSVADKVEKGKSIVENPMDVSDTGGSRRLRKFHRELGIRSVSPTGRVACRIRSKRRRQIAFSRDTVAESPKNASSKYLNSQLVVPDDRIKSTSLSDHASENASALCDGLAGNKRTVDYGDEHLCADGLHAVCETEKSCAVKERDMTTETCKESTQMDLLDETRRTCNRSMTSVDGDGQLPPGANREASMCSVNTSNRGFNGRVTPSLVPDTPVSFNRTGRCSKSPLQRLDPLRNRSPSPAIDPFRPRVRSSTPPPCCYHTGKNKTQKTSFGKYFPKLESGNVSPQEEKSVRFRTRRVEFVDPTHQCGDSPVRMPRRSLSPTPREVLPPSSYEDMPPPIDRWVAHAAESRMKIPMSLSSLKSAKKNLMDEVKVHPKVGKDFVDATTNDSSKDSISDGNANRKGESERKDCGNANATKETSTCDIPVAHPRGRKVKDDVQKEHHDPPISGGHESWPVYRVDRAANATKDTSTCDIPVAHPRGRKVMDDVEKEHHDLPITGGHESWPVYRVDRATYQQNEEDAREQRRQSRILSRDSVVDSLALETTLLGCRVESTTNATRQVPVEKGSTARNFSVGQDHVKLRTGTNHIADNIGLASLKRSTISHKSKSDSLQSPEEYSEEVCAVTSPGPLSKITGTTAELERSKVVKQGESCCSNDSSLDLLPWRPTTPPLEPSERSIPRQIISPAVDISTARSSRSSPSTRGSSVPLRTGESIQNKSVPQEMKACVKSVVKQKNTPSHHGPQVVTKTNPNRTENMKPSNMKNSNKKKLDSSSSSLSSKTEPVVSGEGNPSVVKSESKPDSKIRRRRRSRSVNVNQRGTMDNETAPSNKDSARVEMDNRMKVRTRSQIREKKDERKPSRSSSCDAEVLWRRHESRPRSHNNHSSQPHHDFRGQDPPAIRADEDGPEKQQHRRHSEVSISRSSTSRKQSTSPSRLGRRRSAVHGDNRGGHDQYSAARHDDERSSPSRSKRRPSTGHKDSRGDHDGDDPSIRSRPFSPVGGRVRQSQSNTTSTTPSPSTRHQQQKRRSSYAGGCGNSNTTIAATTVGSSPVVVVTKERTTQRRLSSFCPTNNVQKIPPMFYTPQVPKKKKIMMSSPSGRNRTVMSPREFLAVLDAININE